MGILYLGDNNCTPHYLLLILLVSVVLLSQVDMAHHPLTRVEVLILIPVSPTAQEVTAAAAARPLL